MATASAVADGAAQLPRFTHGGCRYDQGMYRGRLSHFLDIIDPRLLLVRRRAAAASDGAVGAPAVDSQWAEPPTWPPPYDPI